MDCIFIASSHMALILDCRLQTSYIFLLHSNSILRTLEVQSSFFHVCNNLVTACSGKYFLIYKKTSYSYFILNISFFLQAVPIPILLPLVSPPEEKKPGKNTSKYLDSMYMSHYGYWFGVSLTSKYIVFKQKKRFQ